MQPVLQIIRGDVEKTEYGELIKDVTEKTIEQLTQEAALKERERMVREAKEAKKRKEVVDPTVLEYKEKVWLYA